MPASTFDLLLIRHGTTDWNEEGRLMGRNEIPLNARGRAQAEALATALADVPFSWLLVSPRRRAQETAAVIAAARTLTVQTDSALDEVWVGRWQGKTWQDLREDRDVQRFLADPTSVSEAIESPAQVQSRIVARVEALRAAAPGSPVALVSHGDPLRVLIAHYLSMPLASYRRLTIDTGSLSILRIDASGGHRLVMMNWRPPGSLSHLLA